MKSLAEIKRSIKRFSIKPAADTKERTLADVLKAQQEAKKTEAIAMWRISGSRITQLTVAAVVIIAVVVGVKMIGGFGGRRDKEIDGRQDISRKQITVDNSREKLDAELKDVEQMFAAGDLAGLLEMLDRGQWETKVAAAGYLAIIGDLSAVRPLEDLAEKWQEDPADNPFAAAVSEIRKRLEQEVEEVTIPTTPAKKTITWVGIVVDPNDKPIEGVDVRADLYYNVCYTEWRIFEKTAAKARTDKSGKFKLSVFSPKYGMSHTLVFENPQYRSISYPNARFPSNNMRIQLVRARLSSVAGRVIDEKGDVIEGAFVRAQINRHRSNGTRGRGYTLTTDTNSDGWFFFDKIYEGAKLHIDVWKEGYLRYSTESIGRDVYPIRAGMDDLLFTLEPGGTIFGHLTYQGKPYRREGILVVARQTGSRADGQAVTDKNGEFRISGLDPKRRHTLTIDKNFFEGTNLICKPTENIKAGPGEKTEVALELQPGVPVTVRIIDGKTGRPVNNQFVSAVLWDPNYRKTRKPVNIRVADDRTDASGCSVFMLTPNDYKLHVYEWDPQSKREKRLSHDFKVDADSNEVTVEVSITSPPPGPMFNGKLVDTEGKPVEAQVRASGKQATSHSEGDFELSLPNEYYISRVSYAYNYNRNNKTGRAFIFQDLIDANETEIVLEPLVDIVGRVVDPNGEALPNAIPKIGILRTDGRWYRERHERWKTEVDKNGWFRIERVPIGVPMVVCVTPPGNTPDVILDRMQPGKEIDVGDIVVKGERLKQLREEASLEWNGTLSGLVTDEYGDPVIGANVRTTFARRGFGDITDIDGRYRLTGLPRGKKLKLYVKHPDASASYDVDVICDGNDFDVQLSPKEPK